MLTQIQWSISLTPFIQFHCQCNSILIYIRHSQAKRTTQQQQQRSGSTAHSYCRIRNDIIFQALRVLSVILNLRHHPKQTPHPSHSFSQANSIIYSASSSPLLLRGTPNTALILCQRFTPKRHRQLQVKDLPKIPTWQLEQDSNLRPFGWKVQNLPMSHHAPCLSMIKHGYKKFPESLHVYHWWPFHH